MIDVELLQPSFLKSFRLNRSVYQHIEMLHLHTSDTIVNVKLKVKPFKVWFVNFLWIQSIAQGRRNENDTETPQALQNETD